MLDLIDAAREMFGFAMVLATHDPAVGARANRTIELADGALRTGWRREPPDSLASPDCATSGAAPLSGSGWSQSPSGCSRG